MDKWAGIFANQRFKTTEEALNWVIGVMAMARAKKNPTVVKGRPIRLTRKV
jgi:hypothetical protein